MMVLGPKAPQSLFQNYSISSVYSYTVNTQNGSSSTVKMLRRRRNVWTTRITKVFIFSSPSGCN